MNAEEFQQWQFENGLVASLIKNICKAEAEELSALGLPSDPRELTNILSGASPFKWRKKTEVRDRKRAHRALLLDGLIRQLGGHLSLTNPNANLAAHTALYVAANSSLNVLAWMRSQKAKAGGTTRGKQQIVEAIAKADKAGVQKAGRTYDISDSLQQQGTRTGYIAKKTGLSKKAVQRDRRRRQRP